MYTNLYVANSLPIVYSCDRIQTEPVHSHGVEISDLLHQNEYLVGYRKLDYKIYNKDGNKTKQATTDK